MTEQIIHSFAQVSLCSAEISENTNNLEEKYSKSFEDRVKALPFIDTSYLFKDPYFCYVYDKMFANTG